MIPPHVPVSAASSPDDDPTGVRALLAALPEPDPMPAYLVERIGASLAAEQAQRAAHSSGASVTPLIGSTRRRPGRFLFAIAGAAAAVALIGVVGSNLVQSNQTTAATDSAAGAITSGRSAEGAAPQNGIPKAADGSASTPARIQVGASQTRYTSADFVTQALSLRQITPLKQTSSQAYSGEVGRFGTPAGLVDCLDALGAAGAQMVQADVALYEGQPAVIIVATTNGIPTAYAVGRECSRSNPALLHPATTLP